VPQISPLSALFRNCIFWGDGGVVEDEVVVSKSGSTAFSVNFDYGLWKIEKNNPTTTPGVVASQMINNQPPLFDSIDVSRRYYDFHLQSASPAVNKGTNAGIVKDLDGRPRPVGLPDLGCYEKQ
jgi:hypothetical protein